MPKKAPTRLTLDQAYALLCTAYESARAESLDAHVTAAINSALYQTAIAKLWITCPDEMATSTIIGRTNHHAPAPLLAPKIATTPETPPPLKRVS